MHSLISKTKLIRQSTLITKKKLLKTRSTHKHQRKNPALRNNHISQITREQRRNTQGISERGSTRENTYKKQSRCIVARRLISLVGYRKKSLRKVAEWRNTFAPHAGNILDYLKSKRFRGRM